MIAEIFGIISVALIASCLLAETVLLIGIIRSENSESDKLFEPIGNPKLRK
jgi:hypothetical protein